MSNMIITTTAVGVLGYVVFRWLSRWSNARDGAFRSAILGDVTELMSQHFGAPAGAYLGALETLVAGGPADLRLAPLARVECEVSCTADRAVYRRAVTVWLLEGGRPLRCEVVRELPWGDLAGTVRGDFLRHGGERQVYLILERGPGADTARDARENNETGIARTERHTAR
jgi:hypothetical protein